VTVSYVNSGAKIYFKTLGCKANQCDTVALARKLTLLGCRIVESPRDADVCVVNTCAVTQTAVKKSRQACRSALRLSDGAKVFVIGCWPTAEVDVVEETGAAAAFKIEDRDKIHESVLEHLAGIFPVAEREDAAEPTHLLSDRTRHFVKIQDGCDQFCSYCIVPHLRGPMTNRPLGEILDEVRSVAAAGHREVVLTGIRTGAWRGQGDQTIVELVKRIEDETQVERIRISSIEPLDFTPNLTGLFGQKTRVCPHFHIPLQSGSDKVLADMNRGYTTADYDAIVDRIRSADPKAAISTDVLVGYPTETDEDFAQTMSYLERVGFSRLHVFQFSPRPGTPAAEIKPTFPNSKVKERSEEAIALGRRLQDRYHASFVGETAEILVESHGTRTGLASGLSPNYIRVEFPVGGRDTARGEIVEVEIKEARADGALGRLKGEAKRWTAASSAR
jgi:threonylcarbamoyladenosine tRNA methylthiotransferase MtaB